MLSVKRVWAIINSPYKIWVVFNAYRATKSNPSGKMYYFYFWIFNWSNSILKYGNLSSDDFDIESVDLDFRIENIVPADYLSDMFEPIGANKIQAQRRTTLGSLKKWIEEKTNENR